MDEKVQFSGPPSPTTAADLLHAVRSGTLTEDAWSGVVGCGRPQATLVRWADELAGESDTAKTVRLLRAHAALLQRRFPAALAAFSEALHHGALGRIDCLSYAAAYRALGDHSAALAILSYLKSEDTDEDVVFWRAISELELCRPLIAADLLKLSERRTKQPRTDWLATYLAVALRRQYKSQPASRRSLAARYLAIQAAESAELIFALIDYKSPDLAKTSCNVGDHIQSASVMRHVARYFDPEWSSSDPRLAPIFRELRNSWPECERQPVQRHIHVTVLDRDTLWPAHPLFSNHSVWAVLHGWYYHRSFGLGRPFPAPDNLKLLILSFHLHEHQDFDDTAAAFLRKHQPIGCRDWPTVYWLVNRGIEAFFSGCLTATLSLAAPSQKREGSIYVDAFPPRDIDPPVVVSHETETTRLSGFSFNIKEALRLLKTYATAAHVTTSRLHCYLPCRALGTPVTFVPHNAGNRRFDGLVDLDASQLDQVRTRLTCLMSAVLPMIFNGAPEAEIRSHWRELTAPLVAEARARLFAEPRIFERELWRASEPPPRPTSILARPRGVTVVLSFDRSYVRHVLPLIESIKSHSSESVSFVFLVRRLGSKELEAPLRLAGPNVKVLPMDRYFDGTMVRLWGTTSLSTMDRLFLPELLPEGDRVVYLDIDTIMLGDVAELADVAPSSRGISARPTPTPQLRFQLDALEYAARSLDSHSIREFRRMAAADVNLWRPSFNAGVLVLSLDRLRALNFTATSLRIVEQFGFQDEQTLNIFSKGEFTELPLEWNAMPYSDWFDEAKLIHWAGANKPWLARPIRFAERWRRYGGVTDLVDPRQMVGFWGDRDNYAYAWEDRARRAAGFISPGSRVLDLGCGRMALRRFLPTGCRYVPADLAQWTEEVIPVDLETGAFPRGSYDVVVILGVLEHLTDPINVMRQAREHGRELIVSYCHPGRESSVVQRRGEGWINGLTEDELAAAFAACGWKKRSSLTYAETPTTCQIIYAHERAESAS